MPRSSTALRRMRNVMLLLLSLSRAELHAQVNLSNGLVAHYPLNGTFMDASGFGNHGTGMNGVAFGPDRSGTANGAASFDGTDDWINVPASASLSPSSKFSLAFRFFTTSSAFQMIASKADFTGGGSPNNLQYVVGINAGSVLSTNALYWTSSHNGTCITSNSSPALWRISLGDLPAMNQWHCVVLTFENGVKKVYMNGSLISTTTISGTASDNSIDSCTGGAFRLGVWWANDPLWFKGLIDDVRIYNRALSQLEADSFCNLKPESGVIINKYAALTGLTPDCSNAFPVDDASGFAAGDTVLMIQMKGAAIDSSNTANFGQIAAMNSAGNYEYNIVQSVAVNVITLRNQVLKSYDIPAGKVQFVRVPSFPAYTVARQHTCMPWNGSKGGVFAIKVAGTLTLNAPINVDSLGFRGGQPLLLDMYTCNKTDYYYPPTNNDGGQKGEGVAEISLSRGYGRGRLANGGGGGNDHNSGGGGGGTFGTGGTGGDQYNLGACATNPAIGGLGGALSAANLSGRMIMGGGGGCGHGNNTAEKPGGSGGGIVILDAGAIVGNGQRVSANGGNSPQCSGPGVFPGPCQNDAGSGGGGGGLVYITSNTITSGLQVSVGGGKGSDVWLMSGIPSTGPGGGGAGGGIALVGGTAGSVTQNLAGGASGISSQLATNHNAQAGGSGQTLASAPIPFATAPFAGIAVKPAFRDSVTGCLSRQLIVSTTPAPFQYSWTVPGVGASTDPSPEFTFPGYGNYEVVLYVIYANGCRDSVRRMLLVTQPRGVRSDSTFCAGKPVRLTARGGIAYSWTPATGLSTSSARSVDLTDIDASIQTTRTYYVEVSISNGCVVTDTFRLTVHPAPFAAFSIQPDPPLPNTPVLFINQSRNALGYSWDFGDGKESGETTPQHLFTQTGTFNICLVAVGIQGCRDTVCREIQTEYRKALGIPTGFSPNGDGNNDILLVKGGPFATMSFSVFNRWGQRVFQTGDAMTGWDGSFRGQQQPIDVYAYIVNVTFLDGSTETRKGNITLLR